MEIRVTIERVAIRLTGDMNMADIFDRIAAALGALQAGNDTALQAHVAEIDTHLKNVDDEVLGLQNDDTSDKTRLDAIEAGLNKIADTVAPNQAPAGNGSSVGSTSGSGTTSQPSDGSGSADVGPGADAPRSNVSGPGSETTGQVDTPVNQ